MGANIKTFVIDASFVLGFLMPDEADFDVDTHFNRYKSGLANFVAPPLLPFEVVNGLKLGVTRKRITSEYAKERISEFLDYEIDVKHVDFLKIFALAEKFNLTVYDASYVYLAKLQDTQLLSLDKKLTKLA